MTMLEKLQHFLDNTPDEEIKRLWDSGNYLDKEGLKVTDWLKQKGIKLKIKMENYYYISDSVYKAFPNLKVSKPFSINGNGGKGYVAIIPEFSVIEEYYKVNNPNNLFAYECVDSAIDLMYDSIDYDENDNEIETVCTLNLEVCKEWGLIEAIEQELGVSKEQNIAYVIFKLAERNDITPIEVANLTN